MVLTRTDVYLKLDELVGMTKEEKYESMSAWLPTVTDKPEMVLNDLESYPNYAE